MVSNLYEHPMIKSYFNKYPRRRNKITSDLRIYCKERGITVDELLELGATEHQRFIDYILNAKNNRDVNTRRIRVSQIKHFLRFHGINIPKYTRVKPKKKSYYDGDEILERYLYYGSSSYSASYRKKLSLTTYCKFRNMTPQEIYQEGLDKSEEELHYQIMLYYRNVIEPKGNKSGWKSYITPLIHFYLKMCKKSCEFNSGERPQGGKRLRDNVTVNKDIVRQLLEGADERDRMVILALWDSGMNSVDLANLTYGMLKNYLNLDNPEFINEIAVIKYIRQKTNNEYYIVFGKQSLRAMSVWLKMRRDGNLWEKESIDDSTVIITRKTYPFVKLQSFSFTYIIKTRSRLCGFDKYYTPANFRNSFNTRLQRAGVSYVDKEMLMGHSIGLDHHYLETTPSYYRELIEDIYDEYFNLDTLDLQDKTLRQDLMEKDKLISQLATDKENLSEKVEGLESKFNSMIKLLKSGKGGILLEYSDTYESDVEE